jgi:uncharacterized protein YigE (DUF2233 family)
MSAEKRKKEEGEEVEEKEEEVTLVALFYKYCNVKNPREQVEIHRKKCEGTTFRRLSRRTKKTQIYHSNKQS